MREIKVYDWRMVNRKAQLNQGDLSETDLNIYFKLIKEMYCTGVVERAQLYFLVSSWLRL